MEETDLSQFSDIEITDRYSDIIESGEVLAKAKTSCGGVSGWYRCCCSGFDGCCTPEGQCITEGVIRCR